MLFELLSHIIIERVFSFLTGHCISFTSYHDCASANHMVVNQVPAQGTFLITFLSENRKSNRNLGPTSSYSCTLGNWIALTRLMKNKSSFYMLTG